MVAGLPVHGLPTSGAETVTERKGGLTSNPMKKAADALRRPPCRVRQPALATTSTG
jgi:hypothetical protein